MEHFTDPCAAMAAETEAMAGRAQMGSCRAWTTGRCLVVPRSLTRRPGFEKARRSLLERGFPVVVRLSGGGIVPQGPGVLNVSVTVPIARHERSPRSDYAWLCAQLSQLLETSGHRAETGSVPGAFCDGAYNVVVKGRKVAGTAQRRGASWALLHAVILVNPDLRPALEAIRCVRSHVGDPTPLKDAAHLSLAELSESFSDPERTAGALTARMRESRRLRHPAETLNHRCASPVQRAPRCASPVQRAPKPRDGRTEKT